MFQAYFARAIAIGCIACALTTSAAAQSTISADPFELSYASGPWGVLLPSYRLGTETAGTASAYQDDGDTLGGRWELSAVRRFLGTRTSFEASIFYGWAEANSNGSTAAIDIPSPVNGAVTNFAAGQTHLECGLNHYGTDIALRDTWRTRFGGLSAGLGFSYMAFDQKFKVDRNSSRILTENLDTDLVGGKGFVGWDGCFMGFRSKLDIAGGYYDLSTDFEADGVSLPLVLDDDYSATAEVEWTSYFGMMGYDAALVIGVMYISDMPQIIHGPTGASLTTDDAAMLSGMLQISL